MCAPDHAIRRHTVGPGDTSYQPPALYSFNCPSGFAPSQLLPILQCNNVLLPHTNLPLNLPLVQNQPPQNFQIKDQHLLKPPTVMGASKFIHKNITILNYIAIIIINIFT